MGEPGAGQGGTGQVRTGQVGTGQVCTSRFRTVQVRTGQVKASQAGQVSTGQNGQVLLGTRVWPYSVLLVCILFSFSLTINFNITYFWLVGRKTIYSLHETTVKSFLFFGPISFVL